MGETMTDEIRPALTAEEWAKWGFQRNGLNAERFRDLFVGKPTRNLGVHLRDGWRR